MKTRTHLHSTFSLEVYRLVFLILYIGIGLIIEGLLVYSKVLPRK